jgi:hypothetical protein
MDKVLSSNLWRSRIDIFSSNGAQCTPTEAPRPRERADQLTAACRPLESGPFLSQIRRLKRTTVRSFSSSSPASRVPLSHVRSSPWLAVQWPPPAKLHAWAPVTAEIDLVSDQRDWTSPSPPPCPHRNRSSASLTSESFHLFYILQMDFTLGCASVVRFLLL